MSCSDQLLAHWVWVFVPGVGVGRADAGGVGGRDELADDAAPHVVARARVGVLDEGLDRVCGDAEFGKVPGQAVSPRTMSRGGTDSSCSLSEDVPTATMPPGRASFRMKATLSGCGMRYT